MSNPVLEFSLLPDDEPAAGAADAEAYARMLKKLLPPGRLWDLALEAILSRLFLACGDELARIEERGRDLKREADPRMTDELLPEFERDFGLEAVGTLAERRARVVARKLRRKRVRPADFKLILAPLLGGDPDDVIVRETTRAEAVAMADDREIYRFFIQAGPDAPSAFDVEAAQQIVDSLKQSHTVGHVISTTDFICDDPDSLCNRDILGA